MNKLSNEYIQLAYRKLKGFVYYDKTDLNLRQRLAKFECAGDPPVKFTQVMEVVNSANPLKHPSFKKWLDEIDFRVVPKKLELESEKVSEVNDVPQKGTFISNVTSAKVFDVKKVNYFFDGPVELHLIVVLWIMVEGRFLDAQLGNECYGSRLEKVLDTPDDHSIRLFCRYHELYSQWRDDGIQKAKMLLSEEKKSVYILGLDIQEYYYHINLDFQEIAQSVHKARKDDGISETTATPSSLLKCLKAICVTYRKKIKPSLSLTHEFEKLLPVGIPIGLCSSPVLANWYLRDFDKAVKTQIRPAYYGRYVDDILMVLPAYKDLSKDEYPVTSFMNSLWVQTGILFEPKNNRFEFANPKRLYLQQGKCILQFFDAKHSIAGLEKFQKKLEENGSNFLLLPVDEGENTLEEVAYDLLYAGSINKFRSVKGVAENRYELAKYLTQQTILRLLRDEAPNPKNSVGLRNFFKGKNAIEFHDLWERVFTFFIVSCDSKAATTFDKQLQAEIKRIKFKNQASVTDKLVSNLKTHLELSKAMAEALVKSDNEDIATPRGGFRKANLIRHHLVTMPLLNYTNYLGSLTTINLKQFVETDSIKIKYSPRYVNFDECLLLTNSDNIKLNDKPFVSAKKLFKDINGFEVTGIEWESKPLNGTRSRTNYDEIKVGLDIPDLHQSIQIALANVPVSVDHVEASYLGKPVLDRQRLSSLTKLLNDISRYRTDKGKKINLVIFPEVSIPHAWEAMIVAWARKHNIGVICGLEHRVNSGKEALNEVLAALPYKVNHRHLACAPIRRLKRFYSPDEKFVLENEQLKIPDSSDVPFQLFRWRGVSFAVYNCYELSSIEDRSLFKGKVDFIVGTEFNKDVNYFSNIVESAARDIHCYVIQVNDSHFGDSRIVSPSKTDHMNPLRIKGGDNLTFLTMRLDLKALRDHQRKGYGLQKDSKLFKPTPPGFNPEYLDVRIQMGNIEELETVEAEE